VSAAQTESTTEESLRLACIALLPDELREWIAGCPEPLSLLAWVGTPTGQQDNALLAGQYREGHK